MAAYLETGSLWLEWIVCYETLATEELVEMLIGPGS